MIKALTLVGLLAVTLNAVSAFGATDQRNLETCLSGKYPALCDHGALTQEQLRKVRAAEYRENLAVCLTGKYPALCRHGDLIAEDRPRVAAAERRANWETCATGKYPALCNHSLLTADEARKVMSAEAAENRRICLDGRYPALCNHSRLSAEDLKTTRTVEAKAAASRPASPGSTVAPGGRGRSGCEAGHWIQEVSGNGKIVTLEDGSILEVDAVDTITSAIWLPISKVVLCGSTLIKTDDDESVSVTPLKRGAASGTGRTSKPSYEVEASADDDTFVINGELFKAKTYCFNLDKGDRVVFVEGSALGACASAKVVNLRTGKTCDLWCE